MLFASTKIGDMLASRASWLAFRLTQVALAADFCEKAPSCTRHLPLAATVPVSGAPDGVAVTGAPDVAGCPLARVPDDVASVAAISSPRLRSAGDMLAFIVSSTACDWGMPAA